MKRLIAFFSALAISIGSSAQAQFIGPVPGSGGGTPGGADTQLQYNNAGAFGGLSTLTWDGTKFSLSAQLIDSTNGAASTPPSLLSGTWFTGGTATTTKPQFLVEPAGTTSTAWSTSGTGLGVNAPAGFTGNLADLQTGGSSKFVVSGNGNVGLGTTSPQAKLVAIGDIGAAGNIYIGDNQRGFFIDPAGSFTYGMGKSAAGSSARLDFFANGIRMVITSTGNVGIGTTSPTQQLTLRSTGNYAIDNGSGTADLMFGRNAAASFRFGAADAAAPIAQTIGPQSVVAGTTNGAGANWTINNSLSTGSGVGGDEVHTTSASNAAATSQNAGVEILRLKASATGTNNPGRILASGQIESSGSQPTAAGAGGTCTTGAIAGGANAGTVTLTGACAATNTITLTFPTASATGWACDATDRNTPATLIQETATTTTTAVMTVAATTGATDVVQYKCTAY